MDWRCSRLSRLVPLDDRVRGSCLFGLDFENTAPGLQSVLALDDNALPRAKTGVDHRNTILHLSNSDCPHCHCVVRRNHEHVSPVPAVLHCCFRHDNTAGPCGEMQPSVDKLTGPERPLLIAELRFELESASIAVDHVINGREGTLGQDRLAVAT